VTYDAATTSALVEVVIFIAPGSAVSAAQLSVALPVCDGRRLGGCVCGDGAGCAVAPRPAGAPAQER
jgi:hypothetical protein